MMTTTSGMIIIMTTGDYNNDNINYTDFHYHYKVSSYDDINDETKP